MKKISVLSLLCSVVLISSFICACVPKGTVVNTGTNKITEDKQQASSFEPFYVYEDFQSKKNHYSPSGWMGNIANFEVDVSYNGDSYSGKYCIKMVYKKGGLQSWSGIYWQHPPNNWGDKKGGYNLTGATKLTFWAKGNHGREVISEAKVGGISGKINSDSDVAWIGPVKLTTEWKKYTINLSKSDLSSIFGGFCIVFKDKDNPNGCTVYLDEIRYE